MRRWPFLRSLGPGQVPADEREDIRAELELYLELRAEELIAGGMDPDEARRAAEERFGDPRRIEAELSREARRRRVRTGGRSTMGGLGKDMAYALRTVRRSPGFALVAVATLALAIGGNTAIFSVVDAALLRALPFRSAEQLVFLDGYHLVDGQPSIRNASFPEFRDWRERSRTVSPMAAVDAISLALTGGGEAERVAAELVTEGYFDVLGVQPVVGRVFVAEEHDEPDAHPVAVISHALFERRFGLDPSALGSDVVLNDRPMTVIGVMPEGFAGTSLTADLWIPDAMISVVSDVGVLDSRGSRFLVVVGRLTPGSDVDAAQVELDVIARDLQATYPRAHEDRFAQVAPFREGYLGDTGGLLWILMGAGSVLLVIAAANVANLLLVRSHGRTREIVLRRALGAGGGRVASQLLTESTTLAAMGGVGGLALAWWGLSVLGPRIPEGVLPGYVEPELSLLAFVYSLAALAVVGVVIGLAPALSSARLDLATTLREGGRAVGGLGGGKLRAQHVFVIAQVSLALVLMVGAGLLTRSFRAQIGVDTGTDIDGVQAMRIQLPNSRYGDDDALWRFAAELESELTALPGVRTVALASDLPFRSGSSASYIYRIGEGSGEGIRYHRHYVTTGYLDALGVELTEGRFFTAEDRDGAAGVVVITEAMARRVFPGERAIGQRLSLRSDGTIPVEVIGVIEDLRYRNLTTSMMEEANSPDVFFSYWQIPTPGVEVAVRATGAAVGLAPSLRSVVAGIDPSLPVYGLEPLIDSYEAQTATPLFAAALMSLFSALAVVLACVGIFGVLAFTVGQRSREIAIRRAVGASASNVAGTVVGDGLRLVAFGLVVGGAGALGGGRLLDAFLFGVSATDPMTYAGVVGGMVLVALVAALVPALRAMRRDPVEALGAE